MDAILLRMIEEGQHREEIVNAGFDSEVVADRPAFLYTGRSCYSEIFRNGRLYLGFYKLLFGDFSPMTIYAVSWPLSTCRY